MAAVFFILPNGDAVEALDIGHDYTPTHHVTASKVLQMYEQTAKDAELIRMLSKSLQAERDRIRRLMAVLADELTTQR